MTLQPNQMITTNAGISVVFRDTGKHGLGVFAAETIHSKTRIATFSGERVSYDRCVELVRSGLIRIDDPLQIDRRLYLILEGISYYFNHSCDPNACFRNESDLFAIRDISAGEEIRYDYSSVVSPAVPIAEWTMECGCGSANCRQRIGHVLTLPPEQIALYLKHGAFQTYMLNELQQLGALLRPHDGNSK